MTTIISKSEAFEILGLNPSALEPEIKKTYRRLSLQNHPEKNGDTEESRRKFKEIQEAYKILSAD
jgi:curved DNA-binding protein CbpA